MRYQAVLLLALTAAGHAGCTSDTRPSNIDAGPAPVADGGAPDAASADAGFDGGVDRCLADRANADSTVACNMGVYGSTRRDNEIDGDCTPDDTDSGSCFTPTGATVYCEDEGDGPICIYECPFSTSYVTNGGCPRGTRCFQSDEDGVGYCYRDCFGNGDCFGGEECDDEGSCIPR